MKIKYEVLKKVNQPFLNDYKIKVVKKSSFYETPSYPDNSLPKYLNIAININTVLPPIDLLSVLIFIEEKLGRTRNKKNDPRTCDIDIIDYNHEVCNVSYKNINLVIPHPKLTERNFVLFPLQEISPHWKHPQSNENVSILIKKLSNDDKKSILKLNVS